MSVLTEKDCNILKHILSYCDKIKNTINRFGADYNRFINDSDYCDSVSMNLLQIGELAGKLSNVYIESSKPIMNWRAIKGMRNLFAHAYDSMDLDKIWETAIDDIPKLRKICQKEIGVGNYQTEENTTGFGISNM